MEPTRTSILIPDALRPTIETTIDVISSLLSPGECDAIITSHHNLEENITLYTKRDREVYTDEDLASTVWDRIKCFYDKDTVTDEDGEDWDILGLNERWRLIQYKPGGIFGLHTDGTRLATLDVQSFRTINIYLNTVADKNGGATRFLKSSNTALESEANFFQGPHTVVTKVQPVLGTAAIFRDTVLHDGEELVAGEKWLLRTDIMYQRKLSFDFERVVGRLGLSTDEEKGEKALKIALALEDAGNRDEAVRWYKKAFRLNSALDV
jgi:hypothetical protein